MADEPQGLMSNKPGATTTTTREQLLASPSLRLIAVLLALIVTIIILGQWLGWLWLRARRRSPPGPFPLPLIGNLLHLTTLPPPHRSLARLARRYGPHRLPPPRILSRLSSCPARASLARSCTRTTGASPAAPPSEAATRMLFYGGDKMASLSPYGAHWRFTRKFYTTHLLNPRRVQQVHDTVLVRELRSLVLRLYANTITSPQPVNLTTVFHSLMENIITQITFGEYASAVSMPDNSPIAGRQHHKDSPDLASLIHEGDSFPQLFTDVVPLLGFLDYWTKRAMDRWSASIDAVTEAILSKREADLKSMMCDRHGDSEKETSPVRDILDVILASEKPPLTRDKMKAMIWELIATSIDTTSTTLDWAMAEMLLNPRVLKKLQEEVDCVVGKERMVQMADLPKLRYTKAVVKETLRKHPAAPLLVPHLSMEDCELQVELSDGEKQSYHISSGTRVFINAWAISNDPMTWEDPNKFVPERFMVQGLKEEVVDIRGQHFELIPFGSGRRMCPGMGMALGVLELALASLAHCFEWEVPIGDAIDMTERSSIVVFRAASLYVTISQLRLPYQVIASKDLSEEKVQV